jgi:protein-tyrosine phosphatase
MNFYLGCELFAHQDVLESLSDVRCRMAGTHAVLLEFSTSCHFHFLNQIVAESIREGYQPIIAHVERYLCVAKNEERIRQLKNMGALIQVNAGSILGKGGWKIKRYCHNLLAGDLVDFVASDAHNMDTRPVQMDSCIAKIEKKYGHDMVDKLFVKNPEKVFLNQNIEHNER